MTIYSSIDTYDEYGDKVAELCIKGNSIQVIEEAVEEELNNSIKYNTKNLQEIIKQKQRTNERIKRKPVLYLQRICY